VESPHAPPRPRALGLIALIALALPAPRARAIYTDNLDPAQQVIGALAPGRVGFLPGLDFSGIGHTEDNSGGVRAATAISPSFVVSASHYPAFGVIDFIASDGTLVRDQIISTVSDVGGTDLSLSMLAVPLPSTVAIYSVQSADMVPFGTIGYVVGGGARATVGQGIISAIGVPGGYGLWLNYATFNSHPFHAAYTTNGDSGSPTFVEIGGSLAIVGLHYYGGTTYMDTDLTTLVPQIDAAMAAMGSPQRVSPTPTPEPASLALLAGGVAIGALARRLARRR
jgi:hypothetical protein